jgi:hypothetical protein
MVKIREMKDFFEVGWMVEAYHLGDLTYHPGLYPYDLDLMQMMPPWPPDFMPETGHLIFTPTISIGGPIWDILRRFDFERCTDEGETPVSNLDTAWAFFYRMLGDPYKMVSRCRYCFPHGHRYLTI